MLMSVLFMGHCKGGFRWLLQHTAIFVHTRQTMLLLVLLLLLLLTCTPMLLLQGTVGLLTFGLIWWRWF
jgi:hypothetical protein